MIAHELAHVKNRDTLTMTVAATVAGAISMLAQFGFFFGGGRDRDNPMGPIGVLLAVLFAPLAAMLIQMTISRTREYSADRDGAAISGKPLALASALRQDLGLRQPDRDAERRAQPGLGAALHRQPAERAADGQPLLDASERREPHPRRSRRSPRRCSRRSRRGRARSRRSGAAAGPGERPRPRRPHRARRRWSPACWSAGRASPSRPGPRTARWRRWRPRSGRGRRRWRPGRCGIWSGSTRCCSGFSQRRPPDAALNALRLAVAEMHLDGVPAHAAVDGAVRLAQAGAKGRHLAGMVNAVARRVADGGAGALGRGGRGAAAGLAGGAGRRGLGAGGGRGDRRGAPAAGADRPHGEGGGRRRRPGRRRSTRSGCRPAACGCARRARVSGAARLRRGRLVGAGRGRGAAGAAASAARRAGGRSTSAPRRAARRCSSRPPAPR